MIEKWINSYNVKTDEEYKNARREIIQEVALSGLQRGGFFSKACFYGGTALRVFYGLDRYSEYLDFSLLQKDLTFSFEPYIEKLQNEFKLVGLESEFIAKKKSKFSAIESAFLKDSTEWSYLNINFKQNNKLISKVKVKIEVDRDPPLNFKTEPKVLLKPFAQNINCMVPKHLFAGKMHAVLFRQWVNNEKGRDWYDLVWYIKYGIKMGLGHFNARAKASESWIDDKPYTKVSLLKALHERIDSINIEMALKDISRFVKNDRDLQIWSADFFHQVVDKIKITE